LREWCGRWASPIIFEKRSRIGGAKQDVSKHKTIITITEDDDENKKKYLKQKVTKQAIRKFKEQENKKKNRTSNTRKTSSKFASTRKTSAKKRAWRGCVVLFTCGVFFGLESKHKRKRISQESFFLQSSDLH
jgi:hypothetical protein